MADGHKVVYMFHLIFKSFFIHSDIYLLVGIYRAQNVFTLFVCFEMPYLTHKFFVINLLILFLSKSLISQPTH